MAEQDMAGEIAADDDIDRLIACGLTAMEAEMIIDDLSEEQSHG